MSSPLTHIYPIELPAHSRSPSQLSSRSSDHASHYLSADHDPLLGNLSPESTLRALSDTNPVLANEQKAQDLLVRSIAQVSTAERALGIRAAIVAQKLREWNKELLGWTWPKGIAIQRGEGFIPPTGNQDVVSVLQENGDGKVPEKYLGCLSELVVKTYEDRIEEIQEGMDNLDMEELKEHVLDAHIPARSRPSSSSSTMTTSPQPLSYRQLSDFTAVITATIMQALPLLSRLSRLLNTWNVRLLVLHRIPGLVSGLKETRTAIDVELWSMSHKDSFNEGTLFSRSTFRSKRRELEHMVYLTGAKMDGILDALEGREDSLPESWIDEIDSIEADFRTFVVDGEKKALENELRRTRMQASPAKNTSEGAKNDVPIASESSDPQSNASDQPAEKQPFPGNPIICVTAAPETGTPILSPIEEVCSEISPTELENVQQHISGGMEPVPTPFPAEPLPKGPVPETLISETPFSEEVISEKLVPEERISKKPVSKAAIPEEPISEEPASATSVPQEFIFEEPVSRESISKEESFADEEPVFEKLEAVPTETVPEEPITEEPITEEPITEEPITEEPITEGPISEEPISEEPIPEALVSEELVSKELVFTEHVSEEHNSAPAESVPEEPISEGPVFNAPTIAEDISKEPIPQKLVSSERVSEEQEPALTQSPPKEPIAEEPVDSRVVGNTLSNDRSPVTTTAEQSICADISDHAQEHVPVSLLDLSEGSIAEEVPARLQLPHNPGKEPQISQINNAKAAPESILQTPPKTHLKDQPGSHTSGDDNAYNDKDAAEVQLEIQDNSMAHEPATPDTIPIPSTPPLPAEFPHASPDLRTASGKLVHDDHHIEVAQVEASYRPEQPTNSSGILKARPQHLTLDKRSHQRNYSSTSTAKTLVPDDFSREFSPKRRHTALAGDNEENQENIRPSRSKRFSAPIGRLRQKHDLHERADPHEYSPGAHFQHTRTASLPLQRFMEANDVDIGYDLGTISELQGVAAGSIEGLPNNEPQNIGRSGSSSPAFDVKPVPALKPAYSLESFGPSLNTDEPLSPGFSKVHNLNGGSDSDESSPLSDIFSRERTPSCEPTLPAAPQVSGRAVKHLSRKFNDKKPLASVPHGRKGSADNCTGPIRPVPTPKPPKRPSDPMDQKINSILNTIDARIHLGSAPEKSGATNALSITNLSRLTESRNDERRSVSPYSTPFTTPTRSSTPTSFTLAPAFNGPRRSHAHGDDDSAVRLYHLHRTGKSAPIKLFVRTVGENGERVMVRVGGGWADLGEYLREYAAHHGRRGMVDEKIEVKNLPDSSPGNSSVATAAGNTNHGRTTPSPRPMSALDVRRPSTSLALRKARRPTETSERPDLTFANIQRATQSSPASTLSVMPERERRLSITSLTSAGVTSTIAESVYSSTSRGPAVSTPLGLAGPKPKSRRLSMSPESEAWVEGVIGQARKTSSNLRQEKLAGALRSRRSNLALDENSSYLRPANEPKIRSVSDIGSVGSSRRVYFRGMGKTKE